MYSKEAILKDSKTLGFLRSALAGIPDLTKKSPAPKQTMAEHMPAAGVDHQLRVAEDVEEEEKNSV